MKKIFFFLASLTFFGVALCWAAAPKEPPISVKAEVNKAFITIGDPAEYTITIRHDSSVQVLTTVPPPDATILKIKKVEDIHRNDGKMTVEGRKFVLTAFQLGEFILDPVQIQYRKDSGETQTISTDKIFITVKSVAEGETKTDIRGVKSVIAIPFNAKMLILFLTLLGIAGGGFLIYRVLRKNPELLKPSEPPMTPEEEALSNLNKLFESDLLRRDKVKEYYLRLSEILRIYLERRFQILAIEATTYEINKLLKKKEVELSLREKFAEVLEAADLAKFAKWKPEPPEIVLLNQKSKQLIELAGPREAVGGV